VGLLITFWRDEGEGRLKYVWTDDVGEKEI
jgi:hypothetical protein